MLSKEYYSNKLISGLKVCSGRWYSDTTKASRLSIVEIETRVLKVCQAYDKVTADKVCKYYFIISDTYAALQCQATIDN